VVTIKTNLLLLIARGKIQRNSNSPLAFLLLPKAQFGAGPHFPCPATINLPTSAMNIDDEKENGVSPPTASKQPKRYSDKLSKLLTFLDSKDQLSNNNNNDHNGEIKGASAYGLVDITNNSTAVASKSNRSQRKRRSSVGEEKKYVWDSWDHLSDKSLPNKPSTTTSITNESGLNSNLIDQLAELKLMSEQIQTRATTMKMELEDKSNKVEHLHSIRVKSE